MKYSFVSFMIEPCRLMRSGTIGDRAVRWAVFFLLFESRAEGGGDSRCGRRGRHATQAADAVDAVDTQAAAHDAITLTRTHGEDSLDGFPGSDLRTQPRVRRMVLGRQQLNVVGVLCEVREQRLHAAEEVGLNLRRHALPHAGAAVAGVVAVQRLFHGIACMGQHGSGGGGDGLRCSRRR